MNFAQPNLNVVSMMGQAELPPYLLPDVVDLWHYRARTTALLRRYGRMSVEIGRLPSLLGREFFRARVSSYPMANFEDVVIFVADMEQALEMLDPMGQKLLAMNILEQYSVPEVARLLGYPIRTVDGMIQDALDELSRVLLARGILDDLPYARR